MSGAPDRLEWVDAAKGLGILLVVVGHVERGLMNSGLAEHEVALRAMDGWIYSFHMPLFFWLSGLFASGNLKRSWGDVLGRQLRTIVYPYLLWSSLQTALQVALSGSTNKAVTWAQLWAIPIDPPMQFWFLYALFGIALVFRFVGGFVRQPWLCLTVCLGLGLAGRAFLPGQTWGVVRSVLNNLPYYALGSVLLRPTGHLLGQLSTTVSITLAVLAFALLTQTFEHDNLRPVSVFIGIAGTLSLASAVTRSALSGVAAYWGQKSLQIYVAHTLASAGVRILLHRLGVEQFWLQLALGVAAGISFPLALDWISHRLRFRYLWSWPS